MMKPAILRIDAVVVSCPTCGGAVFNPDTGVEVWLPDEILLHQQGGERPIDTAPICHDCGEFLRLPRLRTLPIGRARTERPPPPSTTPEEPTR